MSNNDQQPADFASVKQRLAEIAEAVSDQSLSLDDALDLYEEAVALGLKASDLLETGIIVPDDALNSDADAPASQEDGSNGTGAPAPDGIAAQTID